MDRVSTGFERLDEVLDGGFIKGRSYLLVGEAGTGKTIFSLYWLRDGANNKEKCLFISLAERKEDLEANIGGFGWDLQGIEILDLSPSFTPQEVTEYRVFPASEVEAEVFWGSIHEKLNKFKPQRLVIDSASFLRLLATEEYQFRRRILGLLHFLSQIECTSILTFEPTELLQETSLSLAVDGLLRFRRELSRNKVIDIRSVEIQKFRGSSYKGGLHSMKITSSGFEFFPHFIERQAEEKEVAERWPSGLPQLDELLGGGLEFGTTTLISGPSGCGKTTLGVQYLTQAAGFGRRSVLYTFEESPYSIIYRTKSLGIPLDPVLKDGRFKIVQVNPLEFSPDEFHLLVKKEIEQEERTAVMIDSIKGYEVAMVEYGTLASYLQNLVHYLNRMNCTALCINELETLAGEVKITERGISHLFDNALFIRYAEIEGKIVKVIGCIKKRLGDYQSDLREFRITKEGLRVGEKLKGWEGILSGTPRSIRSPEN